MTIAELRRRCIADLKGTSPDAFLQITLNTAEYVEDERSPEVQWRIGVISGVGRDKQHLAVESKHSAADALRKFRVEILTVLRGEPARRADRLARADDGSLAELAAEGTP